MKTGRLVGKRHENPPNIISYSPQPSKCLLFTLVGAPDTANGGSTIGKIEAVYERLSTRP